MNAPHSDLGASSAERWLNCPGSVNLSRGLPNYTSEYARAGSAAHTLAEKALRKGLLAAVWLGTVIEVEGEPIEVTEEMCEAVQTYLDHVLDNVGPNPQVEVRFDLSPLNPPEPMFGTSDCVDWDRPMRHLQVFDFKYGAGVAVDAHENAQLMYYALGAVVALNVKPETICITIVQPRASHPAGPIRSYNFGWDELVAFKRELFAKARETQAPDAALSTGPWCRFCRAQAVCPEQRATAIAVAQSEFDVEPAFVAPAPETLTPEDLSLVLEKASMVEDWFKAVRAYVSGLLDSGQSVQGWKLVPKRATRKWKDGIDAVVHALQEGAGLDHTDLFTEKLVSPAQAEAVMKERKVRFDLTHLVIKESSGTNLVPDTDPRPALLPSAQEDFTVPSVAEEAPVRLN